MRITKILLQHLLLQKKVLLQVQKREISAEIYKLLFGCLFSPHHGLNTEMFGFCRY